MMTLVTRTTFFPPIISTAYVPGGIVGPMGLLDVTLAITPPALAVSATNSWSVSPCASFIVATTVSFAGKPAPAIVILDLPAIKTGPGGEGINFTSRRGTCWAYSALGTCFPSRTCSPWNPC